MRRFTHLGLMLAVLALCFMSRTELWAKGGRGGFKGGGGGSFKGSDSFHAKGGVSKSGAVTTDRGIRKPTFNRSMKRNATTGYANASDQPWSKHHAREQRKLDHRKQVADHLREVSDRNGNEHLNQVADDMDQRAQTHYDKQMEKIKQRYGIDETADNPLGSDREGLSDSGKVLDRTNDTLDEVPRKLTGRENALNRQIRNEERKLAKQTEVAERMRQLAEQTGNNELLQAADRLDERAINRFDERMTQITDFQQRHDLSDVGQ